MPKTMTFRKLAGVLEHLGFEQHTVRGSHIYFEHKPSGTLVMTPLFRPNDIVDRRRLMQVKISVVHRGVVDSEAFDHLLSNGALAAR